MNDERDDPTAGVAEPADRRRAGRPDAVRPELIPLLRTSELAGLDAGPLEEPADVKLAASDDLRAMTGVAVSFAIALLFWVGVALLAAL